MSDLQIYLGSDHAGFNLKEEVKTALENDGYKIIDLGAHALDPHDDYPPFAHAVAEAVSDDPVRMGILFCGSAEGVCIVANKSKGIRAAIGYSEESVKSSRLDDDANILCLSGHELTKEQAITFAKLFISTKFSKESRHERRISQIKTIEEEG